MDILKKIVCSKRDRLEAAKELVGLPRLRELARERREGASPHALRRALMNGDRLNIIAEYKRHSPSKGIIRADVDVQTMLQYYESGGAVAISVLTEEDHFRGSLEDLRRAQ